MKDKDPVYLCFWAALNHEVNKNWPRQKSALASESKISSGSLTEILQGKRKAKFENRESLSRACGYEYEQFLEHGRTLLEEESSEKTISLPEKKIKTGSKPESKSTAKESDQMGDTTEDLIRILKEQVAELKSEKDELKKERIELNQELRDQRRQIDDLYAKNVELAKQLGEANQALNRIKAQQDNGLASPRKPASNQ